MKKNHTTLSLASYFVLSAVTIDTAKRAIAGEGLIEYFGPDVMPVLEYLGLVKQKMATELTELGNTTDEIGRAFIEKLLEGIRNQNPSAVDSTVKAYHEEFFGVLPEKLEDIVSMNGYVSIKSKNIQIAIISGIIGIGKVMYSLYMRQKKEERHNSIVTPEMERKSLSKLAGIYVTTSLYREYRFFSDKIYESGTSDGEKAKSSFEKSNLRERIKLKKGDDVQICYLVPGGNKFRFEVLGKSVKSSEIEGENSFYLGLEDTRFDKPGIYEIKLTIGTKEYRATANVIDTEEVSPQT